MPMSDEEVQEEIATTERICGTSPEETTQPVEQSQQNDEKNEKLNRNSDS